MSKPQIICSGGGDSEDSQPLDALYARWLGKTAKVLYWPFAMDGVEHPYPECHSWISQTLGGVGISDITMWTKLDSHKPSELSAFDGLYIGGGNTFRLLRHIRNSEWFEPLCAYIQAGNPTYGGSAGAIILGHNMMTTHDIDDEPGSPLNTDGLNLLNGYVVWCHYKEEEDPLIFKYIERFKVSVLACSEKSGVSKENGELFARGLQGVFVFSENTKTYVPSNGAILQSP